MDDADRMSGGKRARTRAALIEATLAIVSEQGFAAASLDAIAARAGMTKGAIYSNFASKAALLLAAMGAKGLALASERAPAASLPEELAATGEALKGLVRRAQGEQTLLAEFNLYALADPELRQGLAEAYSTGFDATADYLAGLVGGQAAAMPPRALAVALQCIAMGFMIQSFITPQDVTGEVIDGAMAALAAGLGRRTAG